MLFSLRIIALVAGLANAAVIARQDSIGSVSPRAFVHFFVCTDVEFGGVCQNLGTNTDFCNNLGAPFFQTISSAGPDQGVKCTLFAGSGCTGASQDLTSPGSNDLRVGGFNDRAESYFCS